MGRLALELEDSPGSGTFTEVWFQQGNQGNQWDQFTVDLSAEDNTGPRQLRFVATELTSGIRGDMAVDEILIQGIGIPTSIIFENFEVEFTTWTNTARDDNNCWRRNYEGTPTGNTGPSTGADSSTWYVFYESSDGCSPDAQQAFLLGPTIDFDSFKNVKVQFWRHLWNGIGGQPVPDLDFMIYKGIQYNNLGDYKTAISIFKKVIKIDKNNAQAFTNLGHSYFLNKNYESAINSYVQSLDINPNDSNALYRLQMALLETTSYKIGFLDGLLEIKVHDSQGKLLAYLQTSKISALKHSITEKFVVSWPTSKIIHRDNQDYSIHQIEFVELIDHDTILGFHEIPFSNKMDLPLASTWHYQIPVKKGDVVNYLYSIYLPVS